MPRRRRRSIGDIITVAGNGTAGYKGDGGPATKAELDDPIGVALDSAGDIFIADSGQRRDPRGGRVERAAASVTWRHHHRRGRRHLRL